MKIEKFKVCFCKKDVAYFITLFISTLIACIFISFNESYRGIAIFGIVFTISVILIFTQKKATTLSGLFLHPNGLFCVYYLGVYMCSGL